MNANREGRFQTGCRREQTRPRCGSDKSQVPLQNSWGQGWWRWETAAGGGRLDSWVPESVLGTITDSQETGMRWQEGLDSLGRRAYIPRNRLYEEVWSDRQMLKASNQGRKEGRKAEPTVKREAEKELWRKHMES